MDISSECSANDFVLRISLRKQFSAKNKIKCYMSEKFENFGSLDFVLCNNKIKNFDFVI
jgi:hypothetical protein